MYLKKNIKIKILKFSSFPVSIALLFLYEKSTAEAHRIILYSYGKTPVIECIRNSFNVLKMIIFLSNL